MKFYETIFIARQDVTQGQVEALGQQYTQIIKDHGGEVSKTEFCGLRSLSYRIKKNRKGHYVLMNIVSNPDAITEMERQMRLNENILRFLTVKVEALDNNPSALMQQRHYKDDYRDRGNFRDDFNGDEGNVGALPRRMDDETNVGESR